MKAILEKFPKAVLIKFIQESVSPFRYDGANDLEGQLLYHQWDLEIKAALDEADAANAECMKRSYFTPEGQAARKRRDLADKRYERAEKLLKKSDQLRGR